MIASLICVGLVCGPHRAEFAIPESVLKEIETVDSTAQYQKECDEIRSKGRIDELLQHIHQDTELLLSRPESQILHSPSEAELRYVGKIESRIRENSNRVLELSEPEWSRPKWKAIFVWGVPAPLALRLDIKLNWSQFRFREGRIDSIEAGGIKRDDLLSTSWVSLASDKIWVGVQKEVSSLEMCGLKQSLRVQISSSYEFFGRVYSARARLSPVDSVNEGPGQAQITQVQQQQGQGQGPSVMSRDGAKEF